MVVRIFSDTNFFLLRPSDRLPPCDSSSPVPFETFSPRVRDIYYMKFLLFLFFRRDFLDFTRYSTAVFSRARSSIRPVDLLHKYILYTYSSSTDTLHRFFFIFLFPRFSVLRLALSPPPQQRSTMPYARIRLQTYISFIYSIYILSYPTTRRVLIIVLLESRPTSAARSPYTTSIIRIYYIRVRPTTRH